MRDDGTAGVTPSGGGVRRETATDVAVVVVTFGLGALHELLDSDRAPDIRVWVFSVALCLPLLRRRRWPFRVFVAVAAVAFLQWLSGTQNAADFAILVALYTVGAYERRRRLLVATIWIAYLGVVLAVLRWAPPPHGLDELVLLTGTVTAAWVLGVYTRTRRDFIASVLQRAATAERERDQQAQLAAATERARISREMHDVVAHSLSVMVALSDGAVASVSRSPEDAEDAMAQSAALGRQALGEVRRLLGATHGTDDVELAPAPGVADLETLAAQVRAAGLGVDLVVVGSPLPLPPAAQLTVYRMVQEALTNVLKHARAATRATITLRYGPDGVGIEIENDDAAGAPVPVPPAGAEPGRGLAGMRERAAVYSGTVESARRPGGGWRVATRLHVGDTDGVRA